MSKLKKETIIPLPEDIDCSFGHRWKNNYPPELVGGAFVLFVISLVAVPMWWLMFLLQDMGG